ncbi:TonB-dependent receptor [Lysobacter zhanggongensis]|uniref:TonB-dependent receptor n=1 Tax=Lysobacter zhanggongensis TaxID=1774951 RepID=A0ABU7YLL2_9GAMM
MKRNLLSVALATATLMIATAAQAQDASATADRQAPPEETATPADDATELDRVTVTGIRRGIEDAIEAKRTSTSIVESVSAEDIGKLPDMSIADSLARLPGLTAQRFGNRPQEINIRGFAGDFSTTLLNGREQVSLGNNRGVEFDQYPSELMSQVMVYKTPDAQLVGQGLSGTVDLRTVRPLSFAERVTAVNLRGDMNRLEDSDEWGSRASISYIDQFADDTVGIAVGYARMDNPTQGRQFESWGYDNGVLGGANLHAIEGDNQRDGLMGVLEWKPSDQYHSTLDVFYSQFDKEEAKRGLQMGLVWGNGSTLVGGTTNDSGTMTEAHWENVKPIVVRNDYNAADDDMFAFGWNQAIAITPNWTVTTDLGHSSANRNERILEVYAGLPDGGRDTVDLAYNPNGYFDFTLGQDYTNPDGLRMFDPGGWGGERAQAGYLKDFEVRDALTSLRIDLTRTFDTGFVSALHFGANLTDRTKSRASSEATLCMTAACTENVEGVIPAQYVTDTSFGHFGLPGVLGLDALAMLNDGVFHLWRKDHADISNKNWEVDEEVSTFYVQADIDTDLGSIPVRGNIGAQLVSADQTSTGVATFQGVALGEAATRGASSTEVLPSLNLSFELPADQMVRVAAARQMARPRMDDLRANAGYGYDAQRGILTGGGGNPELEPWLADAYDVSYEKYFGGKGYVSAAYFYKDLKTYIYNQTTEFDYRQLPIPMDFDPALLPDNWWQGEYSQPMNGDGGTLDGFELAVSVPLDLVWAPLEGFGVVASYSETDSEIEPLGPGTTEPLPGLSRYVSNITAYYERFGFSARVAHRKRSRFLGEVQGAGGDRSKVYFDGESVTDLQLGYTFQDGPMQDLSLLLQVNNLENEPYRTIHDGLSERPHQYFEFGRTYLLGVNYKF